MKSYADKKLRQIAQTVIRSSLEIHVHISLRVGDIALNEKKLQK